MDVTKAIRAKTGHVVILNKVLTLELLGVVLVPVSVHRQDFVCALVDGHNVRKSNLILILVTRHVVVHLNLKELITLIIGNGVALLFGFLLLHIVVDHDGLAQLYISVKACDLKLANIVLGLAHHMGHSFC